MKAYNLYGAVCFLRPNYPPHCIGYQNGDTPEGFSIPCGRGDGGENPILYLVTSPIVAFGSTLIITPTIIVVTMILMYRSVCKIEKNMQNYGVSTLRLKAPAATNSTRSANDQGIMSRIKRLLMRMIPRCLHSRDDQPPKSRSTRATFKKRAILYMAAGYALAWAFVFVPFMIAFFIHESRATAILNACLTPLQGLFNFLVFMSPKVRNTKRPIRGRKNLSWHQQAFIKAYMSRGERRRRTGRSLSSGNTRTVSRVSAWMQSVQRYLKSLRSSRTSTRDTTRSSKNNESNARTTKNNQRSDPEQISGPAEKATPSNPHLVADAGDIMKEAEGNSNNAMRPPHQQQELLATDGDDEEKC
jgi:hypothetical protein